MRKIITLVSIMVLCSVTLNTYAQCTPDITQNAFLVPDTATDFDPAFTYMAYEQTLYIALPTDTTFLGFATTIDSITITGITGLPPSITYAINPASGIIHGGDFGCIQFSGTPIAAEIGTYPIVINSLLKARVIMLGIDTTIAIPMEGYSVKVLDSSSFGIYHPNNHFEFSVFQNSPNPFNGLTEIAFQSPGNEEITVEVYDVTGNMVFFKSLFSVQGYNSVLFEGNKYQAGVYIYKVSNGLFTVSKRMTLIGN